MARHPALPRTPLWYGLLAVIGLIAGVAGVAIKVDGIRLRPVELDSIALPGSITVPHVVALERTWLLSALELRDGPRYLLSPIPPTPCGIRGHEELSLAVSLAAARPLEAEKRLRSVVPTACLARGGGVARAAKRKEVDDEAGMIEELYSCYLLGYVQLAGSGSGDVPVVPLRYAVNRCRALHMDRNPYLDSSRDIRDLCIGAAPIPAPGCADGISLVPITLYNELIVAYLQNERFSDPEGQVGEFWRGYREPESDNPLLSTLITVTEPSGRLKKEFANREHLIWALSNAERLVKREPAINHVALLYNLVQLIELVEPMAPPGAKASLSTLQQTLNMKMMARFGEIDERWQPRIATSVARVALRSAVADSAIVSLPSKLEEALSDEQRQTLRAVWGSRDIMRDAGKWLVTGPPSGEQLETVLGKARASTWHSAAVADVVEALCAVAQRAKDRERERIAGHALELLAGSSAPACLQPLLGSPDVAKRSWVAFRESHWPAAVVAVGVLSLALPVVLWIGLNMRRRREVFTSFYKREAKTVFEEQ